MGTLVMSERERRRLAMFSQVKRGQLSVAGAGRLLGLSERQTRRLWKRYGAAEDAGLVHGLRRRRGRADLPPAAKHAGVGVVR